MSAFSIFRGFKFFFNPKKRNAKHKFKIRIRIIFAALSLVTLLIISRLYFLQVVHGDEYRAMAEGQYVSRTGGFYDRGDIFFTNKDGSEIAAATIKSGYTFAINPSKIKNKENLYAKLNNIFLIERDVFMRAAAKSNDPYEELAKKISDEDADKLKELKEESLILVPQRWRYYPGDTLAARSIGFVAYDGDDKVGRYGLENYFEDVLRREESTLYINFFAEIFSNIRDLIFLPSNKREGDIVTTIEPSVQLYTEKILKEMKKNWNSEMTAAIVMEPKTGKIRALAVTPSFDLNTFGYADSTMYANPLVERVYEMGSIIKPITIAAGIDAGAISASTAYNDTGKVVVGRHTIRNYDRSGRGPGTTMQDVISQSLNTGVVFALQKMSNTTLRRYMYKFGFNEETGVDLPHETMNLVTNLESTRDIEYATASFGQGIALTPMATARALSALGTGYLVQPHLVDKIRSSNGVVDKKDYSDLQVQVLKPSTVEQISRMLVTAVDTKLLGGTMKMEHYSIAAKTGTAQMAKPSGGYYEEDVLHTFVGYFPAYDPKFLILIMNVKPQGAPYASQTITRSFFDITKFLINYYNIPPDR